MSSGLLPEVAIDVDRRASEGAISDEDQGCGFLCLQARRSTLELFYSMREDILADLRQFPGFVAFDAFATDPDPDSETVPLTVMMRFTSARHLDVWLISPERAEWLAKFARLRLFEGADFGKVERGAPVYSTGFGDAEPPPPPRPLLPAKWKTVVIIWIFAQITLLLINGAGVLPSMIETGLFQPCLLYTSPSPRDRQKTRMPSSA